MAIFGLKWPIFDQKRAKKSIFRFFETKFFSPFFLRPKTQFLWQKLAKSYDRIWKNRSKWPFLGQNGQFLTIFGPKRRKRDFFAKIRKCHFRHIHKPQLCAKNQNNPMNGFSDLAVTNERTYGRTYGSETIGPQRRWRGTKNAYLSNRYRTI